jgi:hypothetical protein
MEKGHLCASFVAPVEREARNPGQAYPHLGTRVRFAHRGYTLRADIYGAADDEERLNINGFSIDDRHRHLWSRATAPSNSFAFGALPVSLEQKAGRCRIASRMARTGSMIPLCGFVGHVWTPERRVAAVRRVVCEVINGKRTSMRVVCSPVERETRNPGQASRDPGSLRSPGRHATN